jgi:hypothetical protein
MRSVMGKRPEAWGRDRTRSVGPRELQGAPNGWHGLGRIAARSPCVDLSINAALESPIETVGARPVDDFPLKRDRLFLATALNTHAASPTFESRRTGAPLDVAGRVAPREDGRAPAGIVSVAHFG